MRKIQEDLYTAIVHKRPFSGQNTMFHRMANTEDGWELVLHGSPIACFDGGSSTYPVPTYVSLAGYPTKTTCSRLNVLEGVSVRIKKGVPYLNGRKIEVDGWWSPSNLND